MIESAPATGSFFFEATSSSTTYFSYERSLLLVGRYVFFYIVSFFGGTFVLHLGMVFSANYSFLA